MLEYLTTGRDLPFTPIFFKVRWLPFSAYPSGTTNGTIFPSFFAHARSRNAISSSRPSKSLPVTGSLATEIFSGPGFAGGLQVPTRDPVKDAFCRSDE
jgi:hypothetical protein